MITIRDKEVKNLLSEMTLGEFEKCSQILGEEERELVWRYLECLEILGLDKNSAAKVTIDELTYFLNNFAKETFEYTKIPETITLGDKVYDIWDGEGKFEVLAKDLWQIEKMIKKDKFFSVSKACAIILKDSSQDKILHYNEANILVKKEELEKWPVVHFLPLILQVTVRLGEQMKLLVNAIG